MPIHRASVGWQWGNHGHVYPTRQGAEKQAAAAHANGWKGDSVEEIGRRLDVLGDAVDSLGKRLDAVTGQTLNGTTLK